MFLFNVSLFVLAAHIVVAVDGTFRADTLLRLQRTTSAATTSAATTSTSTDADAPANAVGRLGKRAWEKLKVKRYAISDLSKVPKWQLDWCIAHDCTTDTKLFPVEPLVTSTPTYNSRIHKAPSTITSTADDIVIVTDYIATRCDGTSSCSIFNFGNINPYDYID